MRVGRLVLSLALCWSALSSFAAFAEGRDVADQHVAVALEVNGGASFPISRSADALTANCMDVSRSICLGNATKEGRGDGGGLFAIGGNARPLGLVGFWTFDDALAQDHTGLMDPVFPRPAFGPGLNGGASAYFNGTSLHWISPVRTRTHPSRMSAAEKKYIADGFKKRGQDGKRGKRGNGNGKGNRKGKGKTAMNAAARAAIAQSKTANGGATALAALSRTPLPADGVEDLTVSFWVYLLSDVVGKFRTLVYRGDREGATPHISLWPEIRRIHLRASTGVDPVTHAKTHITLDSHSSVLLGRWTHIAFVVQGHRLAQLYVNGVLDTQKLSLQPIRTHLASDVMYLANNPFFPNSGVKCYMDQIAVYNRALTRGQVNAIGSVAFPGIDASGVKLGCASCSLAAAAQSCIASKGSHLCTRTELNSGALLVARTMGWLSNMVSVQVYSAEDDVKARASASNANANAANEDAVALIARTGAGLCCRNA